MAKVQFLPAVLALNVGVIVALVLLTLVFGRVYCSVICPLGVFQDGISWLGTRRSKKPYLYKKENKWLRYGVWALFVVALVAGVQALVALLAPYSAYGRMVQNLLQPVYLWGNNLLAHFAERAGSYTFYQKEVWIRSIPTFVVAVVTLVVVVALSFKGGRTYCNSICPVGTTLSFLSRFAMFRPLIDHDKCKHCKACELHCKARCIAIGKDTEHIDHSRCVDCFNCIDNCKFGAMKYSFAYGKKADAPSPEPAKQTAPSSETASDGTGRRAFITSSAIALASAALHAQDKKTDGGLAAILPKKKIERETPITPFGSESVKDFYRRCTACQLCVSACPNNVLRPSSDLNRLMQPEMSYEKGYCRPECVRCSEVCPTGAILRITPEEKTRWKVGTASVDYSLCVAADRDVSCGNCANHCPAGAIMMVRKDPEEKDSVLIPSVAEERCIGCGACENLCPSRPVSAIKVNGFEVHHKD